MENNEIMINEEVEVMDNNIVADEGSGIGTGMAMLIGAGLAFAVGGAVKLGKKLIAKAKAKKELKKPDREVLVDDEDLEEIAS